MPPTAGRTNQIPRTNASSKVGRGRRREKDSGSTRSAETIRRLNMYKNSNPIRNKGGKIIGGAFMSKERAGDREITAATGRIEPDRRWFGNTRTVLPKQLDDFREAMATAVADPYSVVLKRQKLPMGLLQDAAEYSTSKAAKSALLDQEPFQHAFGSHSRRKRVKVEQLLETRKKEKKARTTTEEGASEKVKQGADAGYAALLKTAQSSQKTYEEINSAEGIVPWGRDSNLRLNQDWKPERKDDLFLKGQSKRIWGEFFKVVDCSDVVLHVIDARNVPGTRCTMIERHIRDNASHKHLVFVLNKIDLVPNWVAKRWMGELAKDRPTIAFHASLTHAFGKGALISLLRQFGKLHADKKQISVGVIGYPNVGKSSIINTLISKKSCKVAPIPGETKIWQYISLFKRISLIDCPGVVVDTAGDTETDSVLKGVVRAERLENPEDFVEAIIKTVKPEHINAQYKLQEEWSDPQTLMEIIARKSGRLRKGGDPCLRSASIMLINDYQRGRLPHYVAPPELKTGDDPHSPVKTHELHVEQDLTEVDNIKEHASTVEEADEDLDGTVATADGDVTQTEAECDEKKSTVKSAEHIIGEGDWDDDE